MPHTCPICGADWPDDRDCQSEFEELMALEFTEAGYGAVHFVTVTCYMLQHQRYSDPALAWIVPQLRAYVEGTRTVEEIRDQAQHEAAQDRRDWKVMRGPHEPPLAKIAWEMTLADVAESVADPVHYRAVVNEWARVTLRQWDEAARNQ
jgi:hypothetical protein